MEVSRGRQELHEQRRQVRQLAARVADTLAGANASANLHSLLQTCQVNGIDGCRYLAALSKALPIAETVDDDGALLAWRLTTQ